MKRWYITFSGQAWDEQTRHIVEDGPCFGADEVLVYDDRWLMEQEFYALNRWLWSAPTPDKMKGFGWFAWKPFILMHALQNFAAEEDVVLFTDGDTYPIAYLGPLYRHAASIDTGAMFFKAQGCSDQQWIKRDCRIVMGLDPATRHAWAPCVPKINAQHATARFVLIRKGPWKPRQFLMEWLTYCLNPLATTFERSVIRGGEELGFQEHRTEQAIMTLLAHKYGYPLHREACQFGNAALEQFHEDAWYPQLFRQEWGSGPREVGPGSKWRNVEERLAQLRSARV